MIRVLHIVLFLICSTSLFAQIWHYPPKAIGNWQYNQSLKKDSVKQIKVWNHIIIDGELTGEKELTLTQNLDSLGNTTLLEFKDGSTAEFNNYTMGFWELKLQYGKTYFQSVDFDDSLNLTHYRVNDFEKKITYDSQNRPLTSITNSSEKQLWTYKNNKLFLYQEFNDSTLKKECKYYYDSLKNTIAYSTCHYINGEKHFERDSVIANLDENQNITEINDFVISYNVEELVYTFIYNAKPNTVISKFKGKCSDMQYAKKNTLGYTLYFEKRDCSGTLLSKTSYEYLYY